MDDKARNSIDLCKSVAQRVGSMTLPVLQEVLRQAQQGKSEAQAVLMAHEELETAARAELERRSN